MVVVEKMKLPLIGSLPKGGAGRLSENINIVSKPRGLFVKI